MHDTHEVTGSNPVSPSPLIVYTCAYKRITLHFQLIFAFHVLAVHVHSGLFRHKLQRFFWGPLLTEFTEFTDCPLKAPIPVCGHGVVPGGHNGAIAQPAAGGIQGSGTTKI